MEPRPELLPLYLELCEAYSRQNQQVLRDYFALLAADAYLASGQEDEAETLYAQFAGRNRDHVVTRAGSLAAAANDPEAGEYLLSLRQNYPEDVVRDLVQEARNRRPQLPPRPEPQQTLPFRQNNPPPNRGPGNPVPAPRPQPTLPPKRDPAPVRPQPATPRPAPSGPGPQKHTEPPGIPEEPESAGIPIINFFLFLVLIAAGVFLTGWTLVRPLLP